MGNIPRIRKKKKKKKKKWGSNELSMTGQSNYLKKDINDLYLKYVLMFIKCSFAYLLKKYPTFEPAPTTLTPSSRKELTK